MLNKLSGEILTVSFLNNSFVKLYSKGIEKEYLGNKVIYKDETNTFLFFYYSCFTRIYVINGVKEDFTLVQVKEKINKIAVYSSIQAKRFLRFYKLVKDDEYLYKIPPIFFREIYAVLSHKNYLKTIKRLYEKYKMEEKNGTCYPDY